MATKYINLRFHFGGILVNNVEPVYIRGNKEYAFNVDTNHLSISEAKEYCRNFGVSNIDKMHVVVPDSGSGPNKDSTNKVGEGFNAPLDKEIALIDSRGQIEGVQKSNLIGKSTENADELKDEFGFSNKEYSDEDLDEDDVEPTVHDEVEEDENIDLSGDKDGYGSDVHKKLNIVKEDLKAYLKKKSQEKKFLNIFWDRLA
ncbi:hypothetical protein HAX54_021269 [Datura stramonium]|uniref:PB1-like domain-containing protein n=1 Tax=Datura stramonium TaxID=4076 RepID=A0ABS8S6M8_DATST|nr:hypothetical protein [Datura stramonium]